jgi:hypothetical membrane protein
MDVNIVNRNHNLIINPWFVFQADAFSSLGSDSANFPFVYNALAMIGTGIIIMAYSIFCIWRARNKIETTGYSFLLISGVFLMLIGIYHSGTRPHTFVSSWFFIQSLISFIAISIGLILAKKVKLGFSLLLISIIAPIIAYLVPWQSVAEIEAFGIAILDVAYIISFLSFRK